MARCYIEPRKNAARGTESIAADMMRHLHTRQHLGKAVVVCDAPVPTLSAARKQWLKLARAIQKQRSSTLNADKILKYTHMISHMQRMHFSPKTPLEQPGSDIYFLTPKQVRDMPMHCWTVYILARIEDQDAEQVLHQLPQEALLVDYIQTINWQKHDVQPKLDLEQHVEQEWQHTCAFLESYGIDISAIYKDDMRDVDVMDDALDTLLGVSHKFLQVANEFQRALELARPLRLNKGMREQYDSLALLAHRVQALSPGAFTQQFLEVYNEDDTFFLYDKARGAAAGQPSLAHLYLHHVAAGRHNLARAVRSVAEREVFTPQHYWQPPFFGAATI